MVQSRETISVEVVYRQNHKDTDKPFAQIWYDAVGFDYKLTNMKVLARYRVKPEHEHLPLDELKELYPYGKEDKSTED